MDKLSPCPSCGSSEFQIADLPDADKDIAVCHTCATAWEPYSLSELSDSSNRLSAFKTPCNNCAFRKGSPEQLDPYGWMRTMEALQDGCDFHCHKGVPIELHGDGYGFDYPSERSQLRKCRGSENYHRAKERPSPDSEVA